VPLFRSRLFDGIIDLKDSASETEIRHLLKEPGVQRIQSVSPVQIDTWLMLNELFFTQRPEVKLRVYGFYSTVCDLSFTARMTNVKHFTADCMMDATGVEHLAGMGMIESLGVGIYHLESFEFLNHISPKINKLFLDSTTSKKPDLSPLLRFCNLKKLYLCGQQKNIEVLAELKNLRELVLRSISIPDLSYLQPLNCLQSLDVKLGGIKNFVGIEEKSTIRYLELWQVRDLLQSLRQVIALPSFSRLNNLRRIYMENMKSLVDVSSLEYAPRLEEIACVGFSNRKADFWIPLLKNPHLKRASVWFNSNTKTRMFNELTKQHHVEAVQGLDVFTFEQESKLDD
jgi:hypothetical protein